MNKLDGIVHIYLKKGLLSDEARPSVLSCKFPVSNGLALSSDFSWQYETIVHGKPKWHPPCFRNNDV
jgi:hypothetical protein